MPFLIYNMLSRSILLAFYFAVLNVALSVPAEKITPVDLNHRCFNVKDEKQNKSPILLIHGLSDSLQTWSGVMETLALGTGRRVCAVDLRDHGDSPRTGRIDVAALATDIGHFLDKEGIQKVNLVGHSLGGKTSIHFTLNNPERVDSLVSEDMRPNSVTETATKSVKIFVGISQESIKSIPEGASEEEARKALIKNFRDKLAEMGVNDEIDESTAKILAIRQVKGKWEWKVNWDAVNKALEDSDTFMTKSSGEYRGPALFIYGSVSPFDVGGDKGNIMKLFPNAKLVPVEGAGHGIHMGFRQFTDEVIKLINEQTDMK